MRKLPERMEMVLSLCDTAPFVVDVGCDHAYLSIALVGRGIAEEAMATDIFAGPLRHAKENIGKEGFSDRISVHQGDGLSSESLQRKLRQRKDGILLIAGMGGILMEHILIEALPWLSHFAQLVLQPQSDADRVRYFITDHGFMIDREMAMHDVGGHYYEALHAVPGQMLISHMEALYGPCLIRDGSADLKRRLTKLLSISSAIADEIIPDSEKNRERLLQVRADTDLMRKALRMIEEH